MTIALFGVNGALTLAIRQLGLFAAGMQIQLVTAVTWSAGMSGAIGVVATAMRGLLSATTAFFLTNPLGQFSVGSRGRVGLFIGG